MRVLFLTHRLPFAPDRGDRVRAYHILRHLRAYAEVDLVSLVHSAEEAGHARDLEALTSSVRVARVPRVRNIVRGGFSLAGRHPLTHLLLDSPAMRPALQALIAERSPEVVLAYCSSMARFALEPPIAGLPLVIDLVDVDSAKWGALAERTASAKRWIYRREQRLLARFEALAAARASTTFVVNERELETLAQLAPASRIGVVPNGVDIEGLRPTAGPANGRDVVFCGVMDYVPNEEGALWMAREVWPAVRRTHHDARLKLVGSNPTPRVRALADPAQGVEVTGYVTDVRPHLWSAAVSVAPLLTARGVQNKVLEAVAAGLPAVVTGAAAGGVPSDVLPACSVAESTEEFAAAVSGLLRLAPAERRARAERANLSGLTWENRLAPLRGILEQAASRARR